MLNSATQIESGSDTPIDGIETYADARILIVDDSTVMRALIASHLRRNGFVNLGFANDGFEALSLAERETPDLVITDLAMPNMDGFDLCRRLRANPRTADVPILVQTGSEFKEDRARSFAHGASDLIAKPIEAQEMIARVRVHLERRALIGRLTEYQRRMAEELVMARTMQESLLPNASDVSRLEELFPMQLVSTYESSIGLGGDIWGVSTLDANRMRIFAADFTGHGVGSALNTFRLQSFITSGAANAEDPADWLQQLNDFLCGALQIGQFATMFAAVIDFGKHEIAHAAASAPPPLLRNGSGAPFKLIDGTGFPVGVTRLATFETHHSCFRPGSTLILYSDALIETPDPPNALFSSESMCAFLDEVAPDGGARKTHDALLNKLLKDAGARPQDDLTLVAVHHREEGVQS